LIKVISAKGLAMSLTRLFSILLLAIGLSAGTSLADTSASRQALFSALQRAPGDRDLMLRYARASVAERDFEAAVSTLERLIDLDPASFEARYELAVAYYALGSNQVADYHFNILQASGQLTPTEQTTIAAYRRGAAKREAPLSYAGYVEAGIGILADQGETGPIAGFGVTLRYDLGGPRGTALITDVRGSFSDYGSATTSGQRAVSLTFGPAIGLTGDRFGPVLRPYLAARITEDDNPLHDRDMLGLGATLEMPLSANWSAFAGIEGGRVSFDAPGNDGDYLEGQLGVIWHVSTATQVRATLAGRDIEVATPAFDSSMQLARLDVAHRFGTRYSARDWIVSGFVQAEEEDFASGRSDDLFRVGVGIKAFVKGDFYVRGDVQYIDRDSSAAGLDTDETLIGIKFGMEF
jgi:hypothetical protein